MTTVNYSVDNHVARVTLNRPEKYNALDMELMESLLAVHQQLLADKSIRAVVLSGEGPGFCSGLDFASVMANPNNIPDLLSRDESSPANKVQQLGYRFQQLEVPVIAALHGVVFGGGLQIALGADIRIAHPGTELSVMEIKWGLIPDMSITTTLLKTAPLDVVKELTWTGRKVKAEEAQRLGLVTQLSDQPLEAALVLANEIATKNPEAISRAKHLYNHAIVAEDQQRLQLEEDLQKEILMTPNQLEALQANMAKRPPVFKDRK